MLYWQEEGLKKMKSKEKIRYCKVCNCELTSDNKTGYCEKHKRKQAGDTKKVGVAVLGVIGTALLFIPRLFRKK